jgi:hypothetical protein
VIWKLRVSAGGASAPQAAAKSQLQQATVVRQQCEVTGGAINQMG